MYSTQLQREFHHVFPESNLPLDEIRDTNSEFLAIPTNQHAREDLVATGEKIEREKDRLLNVFIQFARNLCEKIRAAGFWADFIDPCSGLPMLTLNCNKYAWAPFVSRTCLFVSNLTRLRLHDLAEYTPKLMGWNVAYLTNHTVQAFARSWRILVGTFIVELTEVA